MTGASELPQGWNRYSYVRGNPVNLFDPSGRESFQIYLDAQIELALAGEDPYFRDPTLQKAAVGTVLLAIPGPEEILLGTVLKAVSKGAQAGGFLAKVRGFFGKLFGKLDAPPATVSRTGPLLTRESQKGIRSLERQIAKHEKKLAEFQAKPTVRPGMEDLPEAMIRQQQARRIELLRQEIQTFKDNIDKIRQGEL